MTRTTSEYLADELQKCQQVAATRQTLIRNLNLKLESLESENMKLRNALKERDDRIKALESGKMLPKGI